MSILDDISNWVITDMLQRSDLQTITRNAVVDIYKLICAAVPFDELMVTSPEFSMITNTDTTGQNVQFTLGTDFVLNPALRAIDNLRISFDSTNKRRLRRSHVRVYDALSISPASRPATYARIGNVIEFNPPPDSTSYTTRFRYWSRPTIGVMYNITGASWVGGTATLNVASTAGISNSDVIQVLGVLPNGYNTSKATITSVVLNTSISYSTTLNVNPGTYVTGGTVNDISNPWNTVMVTPPEFDELFKWETLYRVLHYIDRADKAAALMAPTPFPRQPSPRKQKIFEQGIIPRLWNDMLFTVSQKENVDEDFNINPIVRAYSVRG